MRNTALITGASSGIGLELAKQFAQHGHDVVLTARNEQALQQLKQELEKQYAVSVEVIVLDLSAPNAAQVLFDTCHHKNLTITYLVNNAGFGHFGLFAQSNWEKQHQMIELNITALTQLTHLFLPQLIQQKGKILNVASTAAFQPGPTMAVYYATKAFVLHFSEALSNELKPTGVTVTALCPGATESGFQKAAVMEESKLVKGRKLPSSADVAVYGYKAFMNGKVVAIHGWLNYLMAQSIRFTPRSLVLKVVRFIQDK